MRLLVCLFVFLLVAGLACAQSVNPSDEKQLMTLEEAYEKAVQTKDAAAISIVEKHMSDSITLIDPFGNIMNESHKQAIDQLRETTPGMTVSYKQSGYKMSVSGGTALVTYQAIYTVSGMKNEALNTTIDGACLDVFIKQKKEWWGFATTCTPTKSIPQAAYDATAEMQKK